MLLEIGVGHLIVIIQAGHQNFCFALVQFVVNIGHGAIRDLEIADGNGVKFIQILGGNACNVYKIDVLGCIVLGNEAFSLVLDGIGVIAILQLELVTDNSFRLQQQGGTNLSDSSICPTLYQLNCNLYGRTVRLVFVLIPDCPQPAYSTSASGEAPWR